MGENWIAEGRIKVSVGRIARLEINAPARSNAMSRAMWKGLIEACEQISRSSETRVVILSGMGKHFCAGADIAEFAEVYATPETAAAYNSVYREAEEKVRYLPQPVIAEIRGACVGGGCGLALSADFRLAGTTARLAVTASLLGLAYSPEDTARLIAKVGPGRAKDMLFSGRFIEAPEALSWGLVDRVVPENELAEKVAAYAAMLADRSRTSQMVAKKMIDSLGAPPGELCDALRPLYEGAFQSADFVEGRAAFLEKRPPRFR